jgi:hypothetical protein
MEGKKQNKTKQNKTEQNRKKQERTDEQWQTRTKDYWTSN